jgi:hypothetical protein
MVQSVLTPTHPRLGDIGYLKYETGWSSYRGKNGNAGTGPWRGSIPEEVYMRVGSCGLRRKWTVTARHGVSGSVVAMTAVTSDINVILNSPRGYKLYRSPQRGQA